MSKRQVIGVAVLAVAMLAGTGACAFEPRNERRDERTQAQDDPPIDVVGSTGASASPAPGQGGGKPEPAPTASSAPPPLPRTSPTRTADGCAQGERQREVEEYLQQIGKFGAVTVDGRQSAADCAAIKKFQQRYGIRPAEGRAGPTTHEVARRLAGTRTDQCRSGSGTTVCVNLTLQTVWVIRNGSVVLGPTVTRTGMPGFRTPTGTFTINRTNIKEWSNPYEVWMPYWQHFYSGIGFHETTTYLHNAAIGSHGCINLLHADAVKLWDLAGVGTRVFLFGRRPGT